jgi:hypothetical protein
MATSGAYYNTAFNFTYAVAKASDPTVFFTSTFTAGEVKVSKRSGSGAITTANIASLPVPNSSGLMNISLTASEMQADEITVEFIPSSGDFGARAVSITTEPTPGDILEVQKSAVAIADFRATGFSTFDPATDTVANVTTVGSVSGSVGSVVAAVTAGTVSDKTGYSISGSLTTLDALDTAQDSQHSTTQSAISGLNNISASDVYTEFTSGSNEDVFKANVSGLATASALTTVDTEVGQIKAKTDQLTFTVANQVDANALTGGGGGGGSATSSNQTTIINHLTDIKGAGWTSTDNLAEITEDVTGLNGDAMRGTDGASTTTPPTAAAIYSEFTSGSNEDAFKADVSGLATASALSTVDGNVDAILVDTGTTLPSTLSTIEGKVDTVDSNVDSVLADTGTSLPSTLSTIESKIDTVDNNVDAVLVDTGTSLPTTLSTIEGKVDTVDTNVDSVLVDTGTTLPSTLSTMEGKIDTVDGNVDAVLVDTGTTIPATLSTMDGKIDTLDTVADSILSDTGTDGVVLSTATLESIADNILKRDVDNVEATANEHTLATIILCMLESSRSDTTWTIKRSDGATTHVTKTLTLDSTADPVTGVD